MGWNQHLYIFVFLNAIKNEGLQFLLLIVKLYIVHKKNTYFYNWMCSKTFLLEMSLFSFLSLKNLAELVVAVQLGSFPSIFISQKY